MVPTDNDQQGMNFLSLKKIVIRDLNASYHGTLNTTQGVAVCRDLFNCRADEITSEIASQGVVVSKVDSEDGGIKNTICLSLTDISQIDTATENYSR